MGEILGLYAGAAKTNITPNKSVYIAGYGQNRKSTGVHDPIWCRVFLIQKDDIFLLILSLDLIGLFWNYIKRLRKEISRRFNLNENGIIIACTHNHEGPDTLGLWGAKSLHLWC